MGLLWLEEEASWFPENTFGFFMGGVLFKEDMIRGMEMCLYNYIKMHKYRKI